MMEEASIMKFGNQLMDMFPQYPHLDTNTSLICEYASEACHGMLKEWSRVLFLQHVLIGRMSIVRYYFFYYLAVQRIILFEEMNQEKLIV